MNLSARFIPPGTTDYTRRTLRYDFLSGIAKGVAAVGGAATAAVIAKKAFGANDFLVALLYTAGPLGQVLSPWVARLIRGRRVIPLIFRLEAASMALMAISAFMSASWAFVVILSLSYVLLQCLAPAFARVYRHNYRTATRGELFALVRIGFNASTAVGGFVVGRLLDVHPGAFAGVFPALGVIGLVGSLVFRRIEVHEEFQSAPENNGRARSWRIYRTILATNKRYLVFLLIWAIFGFANMMMDPVRAIYLTDTRYRINADYLQSLLILLIIPQVMVLLTLRLWGRLVDRYPVSFTRAWLQLFSGLDLVIYVFAPSLKWLYLASVLKGLQIAGAQVTWALGIMEFAPRDRVTEYTAIHTLFTGIRGLFAPQVAALCLALVGPKGTFVVGIAAIFTSIALFALFPRITASWHVPEGAPPPRAMPYARQ